MNKNIRIQNFLTCLRHRPDAYAEVKGDQEHPDIIGSVYFYGTQYGTMVVSMIQGLPRAGGPCKSPIFALHIHDGESCTGNDEDPFADALAHYNPRNCPHPYHSGDLPPLFGADGYAFSAVLTDRFELDEIIRNTVIIHSAPDDFTPLGKRRQKK